METDLMKVIAESSGSEVILYISRSNPFYKEVTNTLLYDLVDLTIVAIEV